MAKNSLQLFVVRHGETNWNRYGRIQGHKNPGLNAVGRAQAEELEPRIRQLAIEQILCSDLKRCKETAAILNSEVKLPMAYTKAFRERSFGKLEGRTWADVHAEFPNLKKTWKVDSKAFPELDIEDDCQAFPNRVFMGLRKTAKLYKELNRILIVTHGGVIKVLLAEAEGAGKLFMVSNCALFRFRYQDKSLTLLHDP